MTIAARAVDSDHLADTLERTTFELAGNADLLEPTETWAIPKGNIGSNTFAKRAQERRLVGSPGSDLRLSGANFSEINSFSEIDRSESLRAERRWQWPLSYRSIEAVAIFVDALIIIAAGVVADAAYRLPMAASPIELTATYGGAAAVVAALVICLLKERGYYKPAAMLNWAAQVRAVAITWVGVFMFLAGCVFALKIGSTFSRATIISFAAVGLCGLIAQRTFWRAILENGLTSGKLSGRAIILISDNRPTPSLQQGLLRHGFQVRRQFVIPANRWHPSRWDDVISEAIAYARSADVDELFIAAELPNWAKLHQMMERFRLLPLPVNLIAVGPASELLKRPLNTIGDDTVIELQRAPLNSFELWIKRTIDIVLAATSLIALFLLLAIVATAIKLDSRGPIIFRQTRHGFNGKPFQILKFRTMRVLEDDESVKQAERFDKRVTRLGSWLRRTSIDELPQLVNVLKGDMSIVGPRPHAAAHDNHFDEVIANYAFRQRMKPGITGRAQVNGFRGPTPTVEAMQRRVELDIWYIDNWSLYLDLAIIFRTSIEIVRGRNAY